MAQLAPEGIIARLTVTNVDGGTEHVIAVAEPPATKFLETMQARAGKLLAETMGQDADYEHLDHVHKCAECSAMINQNAKLRRKLKKLRKRAKSHNYA